MTGVASKNCCWLGCSLKFSKCWWSIYLQCFKILDKYYTTQIQVSIQKLMCWYPVSRVMMSYTHTLTDTYIAVDIVLALKLMGLATKDNRKLSSKSYRPRFIRQSRRRNENDMIWCMYECLYIACYKIIIKHLIKWITRI